MKRPIDIAEGTSEIPPSGPEREARRIELVLKAMHELELLPTVVGDEALAIAQQMARHALGEPDTRTPEERARHEAVLDRIALVGPSPFSADAEPRAAAAEELASTEADRMLADSVVATIQAEHDAAAKVVDEQKERARLARSAFERRSIGDSEKRRRELRIDAEVAEDGVALAVAAVDAVSRRLREALATRDAVSERVSAARVRLATIDLRAEARILRAEQTMEEMRQAEHALRAQTWMSKIASHAPPGVDVRQILVDADVIRLPPPRIPEHKTSVLLGFAGLASHPGGIGRDLTDEQIQFLGELGAQILPVEILARGVRADGRVPSDIVSPPPPMQLPSRAPTPTPEGSSTQHQVTTGIVGPTN
jgi:hypothetical protein